MEGCRHACATLSFPPVLPETFKTKQNASRANVLSGLRVWFPPNDLNPPHAACARRSLLRSRRSAPLVTVNYFLPAAPPHIWVILLTRVTSPLTNPTLASRAVQGPSSPAAAGRGGMGGKSIPGKPQLNTSRTLHPWWDAATQERWHAPHSGMRC